MVKLPLPILPLWIFPVTMAWVGSAGAEEVSLDRAKLLEELSRIEEKNQKFTRDFLAKSVLDFSEAGADKTKAVQMYLESYRNVEFGRAQDGDEKYQAWKIENKEKLVSSDFSAGAQLHVQYLGLVCRQALGEKESPKAVEWANYWESLFESVENSEDFTEIPEFKPRGGKKQGAGSSRRQGNTVS